MKGFTIISTIVASIALAAVTLAAPAASPQADSSARAVLGRLLDAHGGLDTWRQQRTLRFTLRDFPLGAKAPLNDEHVTDLAARRHLITHDDYRLGFDGEFAWITPDENAAGLPPRFYAQGSFYFIAMPFVFADPGVQVESLGTRTLDEKVYDALRVTYGTGVGDSAEDDYVLYIDRDTNRLHLIHFRVTDADVRGGKPIDGLPRKTLIFDHWQEVDGLLLPSRATFRAWQDGAPAGDGNSFTVPAIALDESPPDTSFAPPAGAVVSR